MFQPCPSCAMPVDPAATPACPNCDWPLATPSSSPGAQPAVAVRSIQPVPRPKLPVSVTLAVDIDRTGSSGPFADGIRGNIDALLAAIEAKAKGLKVHVITHGDLDCREQEDYALQGGTAAEATAAVQRTTFAGGGDELETHLDAWEFLLDKVPFPIGVFGEKAFAISFTTSGSKPTRRTHRRPKEIGEDLKQRGISVCLVGERTPELEELCTAAQGQFFPISATPTPDDMRKVAAEVAKSIVQTMGRGTGTVPMPVATH